MSAQPPDQILVYRYQYWDAASGVHRDSQVFATIMTIRSGLGMPLYETAKWVAVAHVQNGIYMLGE
jgi:hypothetical protein